MKTMKRLSLAALMVLFAAVISWCPPACAEDKPKQMKSACDGNLPTPPDPCVYLNGPYKFMGQVDIDSNSSEDEVVRYTVWQGQIGNPVVLTETLKKCPTSGESKNDDPEKSKCEGCGASCSVKPPAILGSLDIRIDLGWANQLKTGYLLLRRKEIGLGAFDTEALWFVRGPAKADVVYDPDPAYSGPLRLRQVKGGCLADIVPADPHGFAVNLYHPSDVFLPDENEMYLTVSNAAPFAQYIVSNPSGDTNNCNSLQLVTIRGSTASTNLYTLSVNGETTIWTLSSGDGLRIESLASYTDAVSRVETRTVSNAAGVVSSCTRTTRHTYPFGERIVEVVNDPDGAHLVSSNDWWHAGNTTNNGDLGRLRLATHPDGGWTRYYYDHIGRLTNEVSNWLDSPLDAPASLCRSTEYSYTSLGEIDKGRINPQEPRTQTERIAGQVVSRVYRLFYYNQAGEKVEIVEHAASPDFAYGNIANRRVVRQFYTDIPEEDYYNMMAYTITGDQAEVIWPDGNRSAVRTGIPPSPGGGGYVVFHDPLYWPTNVFSTYSPSSSAASGRNKFRTDSGGEVISYTYGWCSYESNAVTSYTGAYHLTVATYGTTNHPGGIPGRTRRNTYVRNDAGDTLLEETWICASSTNYERIAWTTYERDDQGRVVATHRSDGARTDTTWSCCGAETKTGPDGSEIGYSYDSLNRPVLVTKVGIANGMPDRFEAKAYDAVGRTISRAVFADGLSLSSTNDYDGAGRLTYSRDEGGVETFYSYGPNTTTTIRGDLTNTVVRFPDGLTHYIEQNGVRRTTYAYGVDEDGTQWTTAYEGPLGCNSPVWAKTVTDSLGHTIAEERPAFGGGSLGISNSYDGDRLTSSATFQGSTILSRMLYTYDELGQPLLAAQDVDLNGQISLTGPDRVKGRNSHFVELSGDWWREDASWLYPESGSAAPLTNALTRTRLTFADAAYSSGGISGTLSSEVVSYDTLNNATVARTVVNRAAQTVYKITEVSGSSAPAVSVTINGLLQSSSSTHGLSTSFAYDALGRQIASQDARGAVYSRGYDDFGRIAWKSDPSSNGTWYAYDSMGRRIAVTNALGQVTYFAYDPEGRVVATWGATYPVEYGYDNYGRMIVMRTFRNEEGEGDITRWLYDESTGLLTNKLYADGKGTVYTYTPDGKLAGRARARGITTTYSYDQAGSLTGVSYSDSTPSLVFSYDRLGRQISATAEGVCTNLYAYSILGLLTNETANGQMISRSYDDLGRPSGLSLGSDYSVAYAYDELARFHSVSSVVDSVASEVSYSYLPGSDLLRSTAFSSGLTATRSYESQRSLMEAISNTFGGTLVSSYTYVNDELGRRTARVDEGKAFEMQATYGDPATTPAPAVNLYGYNGRSEVTSASRFWGADPQNLGNPVLGQQYAYVYDGIGNRITASEGEPGRTASYSANELNQYTERTVPAEKDIMGSAPTNVTVTVNKTPVDRQNAYWHHALAVTNTASAAYQKVEITGVYNPPGTNEPDEVSSVTGMAFVAQTPETFQYDEDGNMVRDGRFSYTWNGENRLVGVETLTNLPGAVERVRLTMAYDSMGRRVLKAREVKDGTAWVSDEERRFVYDGWNLARETVLGGVGASTMRTNCYVWGLDLSGGLQGAGGVGGLLNASFGGATSSVAAFATFDGNGNVSELVSSSGQISASYAYDPFGNTVAEQGTVAASNPFRFSAKYWDGDTKLAYYGYRFYRPGIGRWLNRDPLSEYYDLSEEVHADVRELLSHSPYYFINNAPFEHWDVLGLFEDGYEGKAESDDFLGHSDFFGFGKSGYGFDWTIEDKGASGPAISPKNHFQSFSESLTQVKAAVKTCSKDDFQRAMHRLQDFYSHFDKGFRYDPPKKLGHLNADPNPDYDNEAWGKAEKMTKIIIDTLWTPNCCKKKCKEKEWVLTSVGPCQDEPAAK